MMKNMLYLFHFGCSAGIELRLFDLYRIFP